MKGIGMAGVVGIAGTSGTAGATTQDTTSEDEEMSQDDEFAAVRVGNLVPDIAMGDTGESPGRSGQAPGRRSSYTPNSMSLDV
jgi:hypothetical protein